jgi:hypothetical protein
MASVFSLWLIAKSKVKLMVLFNIAYNAAFLLFFFLYVNILNYGLESITIAYFLASMILMLLHFIYIMIGNSFRLTKQNIILISTALLMIFLLFSISLYNKYLGYGLFFVFVLVWFFVSIKKDEFIKVIGIIREKIKSISYFN